MTSDQFLKHCIEYGSDNIYTSETNAAMHASVTVDFACLPSNGTLYATKYLHK